MSLLEAAGPAAEAVRRLPADRIVQVVAHADADGAASAAVAVRTLARLGRPFHVRFTSEHDPRIYAALEESDRDCHLFLDIGAGLLPTLSQYRGAVVVLDHHPPIPAASSPRLTQLNPHEHGLDGMVDACGSTTTLAWSLALDERNWELAPQALVGAFGDRQDRGGFRGWNAEVMGEGVRRGHVTTHAALALDDGPLVDLLAHPMGPLAGLLAPGYEAAQAFLDAHSIPPELTAHQLGPRERARLAGLLALAHLRRGGTPEDVARLVALQPHSPAHAGLALLRMRSLVEAGTRYGEPGLALSLLLGDDGARIELEALERRLHDTIRRHLQRLAREPPVDLRRLRVFGVDDAAVLGSMSGLAAEAVLAPDKATMAYATVGSQARLSARGTPALVAGGMDLGAALRDAAGRLGGVGGGHRIAAGATVPADRLEEFMRDVDQVLAAQLARGGAA